ncbi:hypothetical protein BGP_3480 [Beggiatoa sp. PS]|nr:hypothetical protein BGP_3480 [Beggiatoa sp. PS]
MVFKNLNDRWAIVAMHWEHKPRLGIRWFWGNVGSPFSRQPVWFVIPPDLNKSILSELHLDDEFSTKIDNFLSEKLKGEQL